MKVLVISADVQAYVNGQSVGRVESLGFDSVTERVEAFGIDVLPAQELMAGRVHVKVNMSVLRTTADGGAQGMGAVAQAADAASERYVSLMLRDRRTDTPILAADTCQMESESWRVVAKDLMRGSLTFKVIVWSNEAST